MVREGNDDHCVFGKGERFDDESELGDDRKDASFGEAGIVSTVYNDDDSDENHTAEDDRDDDDNEDNDFKNEHNDEDYDDYDQDKNTAADDSTHVTMWQPQLPAEYSRNCDGPPVLGSEANWKVYRGLAVLDAAVGLEQGPWFRLIQIKPGSYNEQIRCDLIRRPMLDARYDALSYSWGVERVFCETILIGLDETPFNISQHLKKALQRLRRRDRAITLWIDMICIDQQNFVERAAQVERMANIFAWAENVLIWLGEVDTGSGDDVNMMYSLCHTTSAWWQRLWIIQECVHASSCPTAIIGDISMSLSMLVERWGYTLSSCDDTTDINVRYALTSAHQALSILHDMWQAHAAGTMRPRSLLSMLRETRGRHCSVPHDRIYALLNMTDTQESEQIKPDYRKPFDTLMDQVEILVRASSDWNSVEDESLLQDIKTASKVRTQNFPMDPQSETVFRKHSHITQSWVDNKTVRDNAFGDSRYESLRRNFLHACYAIIFAAMWLLHQ